MVRVPGLYRYPFRNISHGSFQTIVVAQSEAMAWELASQDASWDALPFPVEHPSIFPRDAITSEKPQ